MNKKVVYKLWLTKENSKYMERDIDSAINKLKIICTLEQN